MSDTAIKISSLKKRYNLGTIGGQTLRGELQSWWARKIGKDDPNTIIGDKQVNTGEEFWALNGIDLEIKKGEAVGIIGSNGAGKSTLLKILSRVTAPTEGEIWINGRIASMLEVGTGFHPEMTGRENIYMNGAILGMSKNEIDRKIDSIIDFSECRQFIDTPVKRYSSGMYVKLAFSVSSHLDAEIMIMDEVLAVGDVIFQKKCLGKMSEEADGGKTILYVSHNMSTIRKLCSRCIVLDHGSKIYDGNVDSAIELYTNTNKEKLQLRYDLNNVDRSASFLGEKIFISSIEFLGKDLPKYTSRENMKLLVKWKGIQYAGELRARMEFYYADTTPVGMSESDVFIDDYAGKDLESLFSIPLRSFAEGTYYFRFSFFVLGEGGYHVALDDGGKRMWIEVLDDNKNRTRWLRQYWGSIRLEDISCEHNDRIVL